MSDEIQNMTQEFVRDPHSLVFLRLGEALRLRGQLDAANSVVLAGLERYPELPDARDLYARILVDHNHPDQARTVWRQVLEDHPRHQGAHKGLGFLEYAEGDIDAALDHLELALAADPTDASVVEALRMVRATADSLEAVEEEPGGHVFDGLEGAGQGLLLLDEQGRVLGGRLVGEGADVTDEVAAHLAGLAQEAERAARLVELGSWEWMVAEGADGNLHLTQPTDQTRMLVVRDRSVPAGRLSYLAAKANEAARSWLEAQEL